MTLLTKAKTAAGKVRRYWRTPPEGNFMTYKEIASLAGGGIGVKFVITFVQSVLISVGKHNSYGHPAEETLARIGNINGQIFRTDMCGNITVRGE